MQVENLPIYRVTYELLTKVMQYTKNFNKDYKFSLGKKLHVTAKRSECRIKVSEAQDFMKQLEVNHAIEV